MQRTSLQRKVVLNTILVGLLFGLSNASALGLQAKLLTRVVYGLAFLLLGGLSGGLLTVLLSKRNANVKAVDRLIWTRRSLGRSLFSMKHIRRSLQITGIGLLFFGVMIWTMMGTLAGVVFVWLLLGSISGLCYWLLLGIFRGVASATIDDRLRAVPNQGIRHSALNALSYGLVVAIPVGVGGTLLFSGIWTAGLIMGLSVGLLTGLFNGGLACLRHGILRILLWRSGAIPWDYPHFLGAVVERILLSKVGGGYIFLHRLLLDYLAALKTNE
jgi:hypothetical protein